MSKTTKAVVEQAATWGGNLCPGDVVRVSRDRTHVTYRHRWPESVDGRVWHTVSQLARRAARELAGETGRMVEIYSADGYLTEQVEPDEVLPWG
jgi:hypothetical protein